MFPHEVQALMAKILFFIFAIIILTMGKVRADIPTASQAASAHYLSSSILSSHN